MEGDNQRHPARSGENTRRTPYRFTLRLTGMFILLVREAAKKGYNQLQGVGYGGEPLWLSFTNSTKVRKNLF